MQEVIFLQLLVQKGVLSVQDKDGVILERMDISSATLDQDESGMPYMLIVFDEKQRKAHSQKCSTRSRKFSKEFDPGSERTLAADLTHASRAPLRGSGERVSNT